jgi:hypothetical protein
MVLGDQVLKRNFERLLIEAIDEGLSTVGESPRKAIYFHLEKSFNIRKNEIPKKVKVFENAIEKMFGFGADFLEVMIMKRLYEKIGGELELEDSSDFDFSGYVNIVKRRLLRREKPRLSVEVSQ